MSKFSLIQKIKGLFSIEKKIDRIRERSIRECSAVVYQDTKPLKRDEILNILVGMIDEVRVNDEIVHIKLSKSLILQSENLVTVSDNLNILLAGNRIELAPEIKPFKKLNKEI